MTRATRLFATIGNGNGKKMSKGDDEKLTAHVSSANIGIRVTAYVDKEGVVNVVVGVTGGSNSDKSKRVIGIFKEGEKID
jgi:hypothetical protein